MSVNQGDRISSMISMFSLPLNRAFDGRAVVVPDSGPLPRIELAGGAVITLLSPTMRQLRLMRSAWEKESAKSGFVPGGEEIRGPAAEVEAFPDSYQSKSGAAQPKRSKAPRNEDKSIETLANEPFQEDSSVANGSSIAFLAEFAGRALLIGGDAYSRVLEESIERLLKERGYDRLPLSLFVVPHGGSRTSVSRKLLRLIACDRYVIATSGTLYHHPDRETVARIIVYGHSRSERGLTLIFNYRSEINEEWSNPLLQERYRYKAVYPDTDKSGIRVQL